MILAELTKPVETLLEARPPDEPHTFVRSQVPALPLSLDSDRIVIQYRFGGYNDAWADGVALQASRRTCRQLGIAFVSRLFHPSPEQICIRLTHSASQVRELILDTEAAFYAKGGYLRQAASFAFEPYLVDCQYPLGGRRDPDCPLFVLTTDTGFGPTRIEELATRNRLRVTGTDIAFLDLAQLFLEAGEVACPVDEFTLESPLGNGGAHAGGAQLKVWLPGSLGWDALWPEDS